MRKKIYPKMTKDQWGMKFFFNDNGRHYTLRFAGRPLLILEKAFYVLWWKDFDKVYNQRDFSNEEDLEILKETIATVEEMLTIVETVYKDWMSAFVVYADDFNSELWQWFKK